jgi:hypothetical protein
LLTHELRCVCMPSTGFHLAPGAVESRIEPTVADMAALQPSLVVGGHCTGDYQWGIEGGREGGREGDFP